MAGNEEAEYDMSSIDTSKPDGGTTGIEAMTLQELEAEWTL
jgi:hypothetical protein